MGTIITIAIVICCSVILFKVITNTYTEQKLINFANKIFEDLSNPRIETVSYEVFNEKFFLKKKELNKEEKIPEIKIGKYTLEYYYVESKNFGNIKVIIKKRENIIFEKFICFRL